MKLIPKLLFKTCCILCFFGLSISSYSQETYDILIQDARILDGTGNPWFLGDVAIKDDKIVAVGKLPDVQAVETIDASGLYLSPGFIDVHSHAAEGLTASDRSHAQPLIAQGLTTVAINPDGGGPIDLPAQKEQLLKDGLGVNVIQLIGHGSVRKEVLGYENRLPNKEELERMKKLVEEAMKAGAFGLSSGPFYSPGSFSDTDELVELAKVTANYHGVYTSHIRDESSYTVGVIAAVDEVIQIAREAKLPSIVTHIKVLGPTVWGYSTAVVQRIQRARAEGLEVYADQYPYLASATGLAPALLPRWVQAGGRDSLLARFNHPETMKKIRKGMEENLFRRGGASRIQFRFFKQDRSVEGKTLEAVAEAWNLHPIDAAVDMLKQGSPGIVSFNMHKQDVHTFMKQPWMMTSSDGRFPSWGVGVPHPRGFGAFPRKIHQYVVEEGVINLATAIRSMTSLPAQVFEIKDRGTIQEGAIADLVIFDLDRVKDKATFTEPYQLAEGMEYVFVNGKAAIFKGSFTNIRNGEVLSK